MDMLVYGCSRVVRNFSVCPSSGQLYILPTILKKLKMSLDTFREIMVISGTDYSNNLNSFEISLSKTLDLYRQYLLNNENDNKTFYEWLLENSSYIQNYDELIKINKMFC